MRFRSSSNTSPRSSAATLPTNEARPPSEATPAAVLADPDFLLTLSPRETRSGLAEVLKHAIIGDPALWDILKNGPDHPDISPELLRQSIAVKVRVVTEDPLERGLRMLLNYGHSIGHGIESYFLERTAPLTHGEAIAIGMACETYVARHKRLPEIASAMRRFFPPVPIPETAFAPIWATMQHDKKNVSGKVRLALPGQNPFEMRVLDITQSQLEEALRWWNDTLQGF